MIPIRTRSPLYCHFCYMDAKEYLADQLFVDAEIPVKFGSKCRKRDKNKFLEAIKRLPAKAILLGYKDYIEASKKLTQLFYCNKSYAKTVPNGSE